MAALEEFRAAQNAVWDQVVAELGAGRKTSHWIWYVFPQLTVLGRSPRARHFGIADRGESARYLADPILHARLEEVASLLLDHAGTDPGLILGPVDAAKVQSSMTLFEQVPGASPVFAAVLDRMYGGERCATSAHPTS